MQSARIHWYFFFLWPFASLVMALRTRQLSPNLLWAFIVFYGFTFVISKDNADADVSRYVANFHEVSNSNLEFSDFIGSLYTGGRESTNDLLQPFVTYLVAIFTHNRSFLIAAFALVFGYFYSRNVWTILSLVKGRTWYWPGYLLFLVFVLTIPMWNINGFRFWTAAQIFFFGVTYFISNRKLVGLFCVLFTPLVHFSFVVMVGVFAFYLFLGNRIVLYVVMFVLTSFFTIVDVDGIRTITENVTPTILKENVTPYTNTEYVEIYQQRFENTSKNWYAVYYQRWNQWAIICLMIFFYFKVRKTVADHLILNKIFAFSFLLYSFANVMSIMPSGIRFVIVANLFAAAILFVLTVRFQASLRMGREFILATPFLLLFVIVSIREGFNSFGLYTLIGNFFMAPFVNIDIALIDFLKWQF